MLLATRGRKSFLFGILALATLIAVLHYLGIEFYFYRFFWWMDMVTHYLGGIFVGASALWFFCHVRPLREFCRTNSVLLVSLLLTTLLVGLLWEVFEFVAGVFILERAFPDTILDILADIAGGLTAYMLVSRKYLLTGSQHE